MKDILEDGDSNFEESFAPYQLLTRQIKNDPELPLELRKVLNQVNYEPQNLGFPVTDAASSKLFTDTNELQMKYMKAKWDHYLNSKISQF